MALISVLMSVYKGDKPKFFSRALESIGPEQTMAPDEIVIVQDGPISSELLKVIDRYKKTSGINVVDVRLNKNVGLAAALNKGLSVIDSKYVVRMDSDDIALPDRINLQVKYMENNESIDVLGTYIQEIDENGNVITPLVKYPTDHEGIVEAFKIRNPIVHPSTICRKSFFDGVGGYSEAVRLGQDALLWSVGIREGYRFANLDQVSLKFRRDSEFMKRRGGVKTALNFLKLRWFKINRNIKSGIAGDIYAFIYFALSLAPSFVKTFVYKNFR